MWGSDITDHTMKENHVIDWDSGKIVEREREMIKLGAQKRQYTSGFYLT